MQLCIRNVQVAFAKAAHSSRAGIYTQSVRDSDVRSVMARGSGLCEPVFDLCLHEAKKLTIWFVYCI